MRRERRGEVKSEEKKVKSVGFANVWQNQAIFAKHWQNGKTREPAKAGLEMVQKGPFSRSPPLQPNPRQSGRTVHDQMPDRASGGDKFPFLRGKQLLDVFPDVWASFIKAMSPFFHTLLAEKQAECPRSLHSNCGYPWR